MILLELIDVSVFIADVGKGGDFLKSYWAKWSRKRVAFYDVRTVKGAKSNIFTGKLHAWQLFWKPVGQLPPQPKEPS